MFGVGEFVVTRFGLHSIKKKSKVIAGRALPLNLHGFSCIGNNKNRLIDF